MSRSDSNNKSTYHHGDLKAALLEAAARLLREEGEDALSMRRLAAEAGVSRTAPYHHFADKQGLLCALAEEGFRRFDRMMKAVYSGQVTAQQVRDFVQGYVHFAVDNAEYYDLMFGGRLWRAGEPSESLTDRGHASFRGYIGEIRRWQEQGWVRQDLDPLRYAQVSWSTLHGMSRLLVDGIYVDEAAIEAMCDNAAEMFWRELAVNPATL